MTRKADPPQRVLPFPSSKDSNGWIFPPERLLRAAPKRDRERDREEFRQRMELITSKCLEFDVEGVVALLTRWIDEDRKTTPLKAKELKQLVVKLVPEIPEQPACVESAEDPLPFFSDQTRAFLKIQEGCDLHCSYCVIPSVRGASRSVEPETVLRKVTLLAEAGFREIVFTGVNTGDYGKDLTPATTLAALLRRASEIRSVGRLRLNSVEPRCVTDELVETLAGSPRLAPHLQVPLQSGSDEVLGRMRRPYRTAHYRQSLETLRKRIPDVGLGADVIVGFPGESREEFLQTLEFIASSQLNYLHVFSFTPRPGMTRRRMPD
jgi:MiaB/RimO family radical SAM methylthiotransferase